jgi:hypothetical protein
MEWEDLVVCMERIGIAQSTAESSNLPRLLLEPPKRPLSLPLIARAETQNKMNSSWFAISSAVFPDLLSNILNKMIRLLLLCCV